MAPKSLETSGHWGDLATDFVVWWILLLLLAVTIFVLGNAGPVTLMFWQWPIYTGSLAGAVIGAAAVGGLLTLLPALRRQSRLARRIRELERERTAYGATPNEAGESRAGSSPAASISAGR